LSALPHPPLSAAAHTRWSSTKSEEQQMPTISAIHHISLTVSEIERSVSWYTDVLGLTKLMDEVHPDGSGYAVVLGKADWSLCVGLHVHATNGGERFAEQRTGMDHVSFLVSSRAELDEWEARLTDLDVAHSAVNDQDGYSVVVFRDPDNIQLELVALG
jgi:catechol 2,3-dioxygenase-like lactoylglutathione lyase family enzyme